MNEAGKLRTHPAKPVQIYHVILEYFDGFLVFFNSCLYVFNVVRNTGQSAAYGRYGLKERRQKSQQKSHVSMPWTQCLVDEAAGSLPQTQPPLQTKQQLWHLGQKVHTPYTVTRKETTTTAFRFPKQCKHFGIKKNKPWYKGVFLPLCMKYQY